MPGPALNLENAFNQLDPQHSITPEEIDRLFVERPLAPSNKIRAELIVSRRPVKMLFVGHRGAGKSSEMAYLSSLLKDKFLSVPVPLYNIFQSPKVTHTEVVLAMNLRLLKMATDEKVVPRGVVNQVWNDWLERRLTYFTELLFGPAAANQPEARLEDVSLKVNLLAVEFESKIGTESSTRAEVEKKLQDRVTEMLQQMGEFVDLLQAKLNKKLILLVEDLDKFDKQVTSDLFLRHAKALTSPNAHVIYSFPVAMRYTDDFFEMRKDFDSIYHLPNIALKHRDGSPDPVGIKAMHEILEKRAGAF